jgi:hypothetical protein
VQARQPEEILSGMPNDIGDGGRVPSFSQRHGYKDFCTAMQVEALDERTRTDLWNMLIYPRYLNQNYPDTDGLVIWCNHLALPRNEYTINHLAGRLDVLLETGEWYEVYDLLEFLVSHTRGSKREETTAIVNNLLALNRAGYRIIDALIVPVTAAEDLESIEAAAASPLTNAAEHIKKAVALFAVRDNPNFAKAIQEATSGAEAAAHVLAYAQGQTLVDSLNFVEKKLPSTLHPALIGGWKMLYGFTGDSGGIRHAAKGDSVSPDQDVALYFIVTCSAFVNLVTSIVARRPEQQS